jgi:23S rRNA (uracil-5-)-methyltransferase RumA
MICSHVEECGGCPWQKLPYAEQLLQKQKLIQDLFPNVICRQILVCDDPWHYRNKMEYSFSQDKAGNKYLGLYMRGRRNRVLNLSECSIAPLWMTEALNMTRSWWDTTSLSAYHPYRDTGSLRNLTLRGSERTGDKMAMLTVSGHADYAIGRSDLDKWVQSMQGISCFLRIQQTAKGMTTQFYELHLSGKTEIQEKHSDKLFTISPTSFFQPNTPQSEKLYREALNILAPTKDDHIIDLYAGTATIGIVFAPHVKKVTSIEINPYAIIDARTNLEANNIGNLDLIQEDAGTALANLAEKPHAIVVDPPRGGLGSKALAPILALRPKKILYISCNPKTQAVDVQLLLEQGYKLEILQPVDQFPHTPHVENIALLSDTL